VVRQGVETRHRKVLRTSGVRARLSRIVFLSILAASWSAVAAEKSPGHLEKATFAAGCFWHVEATFRKVPGVVSVTSGYTGGTTENPSYEQVCSDRTGHAEAVEIEYDPARVSYDTLLDVFWAEHDPTTPNRQGWDVGSQYRSAIFYHTPEQRAAAIASKNRLEKSGRYARPIVTQIVPAATFYKAEEYHQRYYEKHPEAELGHAEWPAPTQEDASALRAGKP
jgi:peptide-methionine (S)-S-oxide reductase